MKVILSGKEYSPEKGTKRNCPILMCPDDCDFSCILIIAEIENTGSTVKWNKIGVDKMKEYEAEKIGTTVKWFEKVEPLEFGIAEYKSMIEEFKVHFQIDQLKWEEKKRTFQEEQDKKKEHSTFHKSSVPKSNTIWSWLTKELWS